MFIEESCGQSTLNFALLRKGHRLAALFTGGLEARSKRSIRPPMLVISIGGGLDREQISGIHLCPRSSSHESATVCMVQDADSSSVHSTSQ